MTTPALCLLAVLLAVLFRTLFFWRARQPVDMLQATVQRFEIGSQPMRERIEGVPRAFLSGYNSMLRWRGLARIRRELSGLDPYYLAFALEGAAMGYAARVFVTPWTIRSYERAVNRFAPEDLYQNYVGLGWWLDIRCKGDPAPMEAFTRRLDPRYHLLPYEGAGFRTGFLNPDAPMPPAFAPFSEATRHVCYQGYGRSLWFTRGGNLQAVCLTIGRLPEPYRGDVYSGLGLAVAFTTVWDPQRAVQVLGQIPAEYLHDFLQGLSFGWEARRRHDQAYFESQVARLPHPAQHAVHEAIAAVHRATGLLRSVESDPTYYARWRAQVRDLIATGTVAVSLLDPSGSASA